jgi:L-iditol 2-dehydrogenase
MDVVIVSVAATEAVSAALALARRGGIVDLFAGTASGSTLIVPAHLIHYEGVRLQGTFGFSPAHFRSSLEWIAASRINFDALITGYVPMADVAGALGDASQQFGIKTVMLRDPNGP